MLHRVGQEVPRRSPGSTGDITILVGLYIYYGSFLASDSKDLQEGMPFKIHTGALAGVAQWMECQPTNRKVAGLISSQGSCLGCGPAPQLGARERQLIAVSLTHRYLSPSLSPSSPLSLKINK